MLSVTYLKPDRADIELSAVIDGDMMAAALHELIEVSKDIKDGVILYRIPSFSMPTGGAFAAEFMRLPPLFKVIGYFRCCAVLTDYGWIKVAARAEGADLADDENDLEDNMPV